MFQSSEMVPLIPPNEAQLKIIYDNIQLNPEQLEKDIKTLREWLKVQPHLPQDALGRFYVYTIHIATYTVAHQQKPKIEEMSCCNSPYGLDPNKIVKKCGL